MKNQTLENQKVNMSSKVEPILEQKQLTSGISGVPPVNIYSPFVKAAAASSPAVADGINGSEQPDDIGIASTKSAPVSPGAAPKHYGKGFKGHYDSSLITQVSQMIAGSNKKLTMIQMQKALSTRGVLTGDKSGYDHLRSQIIKAFKNGILDQSQIAEGRYLTHENLPKFKVGDKVRIKQENERTPEWLRKDLRLQNSRTIVAAVPTKWATLYYLGTNGMGKSYLDIQPLRACELEPYTKKSNSHHG